MMKLTIYAMYSQSEIPIVKLQTSLLTRLYSLLCVFMPHLDINPTVIKKKKKKLANCFLSLQEDSNMLGFTKCIRLMSSS